MAHYRKIDVAIWNDEKFSSLKLAGKLAYFFLLTHPSMTALGGMRASLPGLADELGGSVKDFKEVFARGLAIFDEKSKCIFVPNFLRYQSIDSPSPNVVKGWVKQSEFIPEGKIRDLAIGNIISFIEGKGVSFREAFDDSFQKAYGKTFTKPVSSKQLAVSKPPNPPSTTEAVDTERDGGGDAQKISSVDPETGEIVKWAA